MENNATDFAREIFEKLGLTIQEMWPYAVQHVAITAAVYVFAGVAMMVGSGIIILKWRQKLGCNDDEIYVIRILAYFAVLIGTFMVVCYLPDLIEPHGALARSILRRVPA